MGITNVIESRNLKEWITPQYLSLQKIEGLKIIFSHSKPFPHQEFKQFFLPEKAVKVLTALAQEKFYPKEADLFKFSQTEDLKATTDKVLAEFRSFLSSPEFTSYLGYVSSIDLKPKVIDLAGTLYQDTDYLLCHDDQLEGRKIAFMYYLSDVGKNEGGAVELFASKNGLPTTAEKIIIPTFNTFAFFLVSERSFHQVQEVVKDVQRISLSGWFYD